MPRGLPRWFLAEVHKKIADSEPMTYDDVDMHVLSLSLSLALSLSDTQMRTYSQLYLQKYR